MIGRSGRRLPLDDLVPEDLRRKIARMGMNESTIPSADSKDSEQVVVALDAARAELQRGSRDEAVQWLRRAVAAAADQGRADRAAALQSLVLELGAETTASDGDVVLSDIDDFSDETIVDQAPRLPSQPPRPSASPVQAAAPVTKIATAPTPVARPPRPSKGPPTYGAVRVSVRRALGGKWEVRPLGERESAPAGEEEALLVPLRPGAKFG